MSPPSIKELRLCYVTLPHLKDLPDMQWRIDLLQYYVAVEPYLWPVRLVVAIVSTLVSLLNVVVFTRKHLRRSSLNLLLISLEVSNVLLCGFQIVFSSVQLIHGDYATTTSMVLLMIVCSRVTLFSTMYINWISAIISLWRFMAIKEPLKAKERLSRKRAVLAILITFLVTLSPHFLNFLTNQLAIRDMEICSDLDSGKNTTYSYYYLTASAWSTSHVTIANAVQRTMIIFYNLIPVLFLFAMTVCLLTTICSYQKRQGSLREGQSQVYIEEKHTRTTIMLVVLLGFYVLSNSVEVVIGQLYQFEAYKLDMSLLKTSFILQGSFLTQITNVFSIFAYYFMGTNFRSTLHELFSKKRQ